MSDFAVVRAYRRVRGALFGRAEAGVVEPDDPGLVVVVAGYDDVESCSAALARGAGSDPRWATDRQALLRHPMVVPAAAVEEVVGIGSLAGYSPVEPVPAIRAEAVGSPAAGEVLLVLARSQVLDALHCSQERSRMAGLAQRHGGRALGWDALQPDPMGGAAR